MRALALTLFLIVAPALDACSCITVPVKARFMGATHVFAGTFSEASAVRATMKVDKWFLGTPVPEVTFELAGLCTTSQPGAGRSALVFAYVENGKLTERGCASAPIPSDRATQDLRTLHRRAWLWRLQRRVRALF